MVITLFQWLCPPSWFTLTALKVPSSYRQQLIYFNDCIFKSALPQGLIKDSCWQHLRFIHLIFCDCATSTILWIKGFFISLLATAFHQNCIFITALSQGLILQDPCQHNQRFLFSGSNLCWKWRIIWDSRYLIFVVVSIEGSSIYIVGYFLFYPWNIQNLSRSLLSALKDPSFLI